MGKDTNSKNTELRSEEFHEILGNIPGWILRRGIIVITCFILIILIGSAMFKYPDVITTEMTLTGTNPPAFLVANSTGKLSELFVTDKQLVKKTNYLGVIENPACTNDVLKLKAYLHNFVLDKDSMPELPKKDLQLGPMQSLYSDFYSTLFDYQEFLRLQYFAKKVGFMKKRIEEYQDYSKTIISQQSIVEKQEEIQRNQYRRDSILNADGLISNEALENTRNQYLQGRLSVKNINSSIQNTEMQITQLHENLLETENQYREKKNNLENRIKATIAQLLAEIQAWELMYVLISPINGEVVFTNYWTVNQNISSGEIAFSIIPTSNDEIIGKAKMPVTRSGKVKVAQIVNIHFVNFPDTEYGVVHGVVKRISAVPSSDAQIGKYYTLEIELPNGLHTTYNKKLPYLPNMLAQADIVTEDISLLERFFLPLKKIWKEGME